MKELHLNQIATCDDLIKKTPLKEHYSHVIKEDTLFIKEGKRIGLYMKMTDTNIAIMERVVATTKMVDTYRANALPTRSSVFGALPRVAIRNDYCRFTNTSKKETENLDACMELANVIAEIYKELLPEQYNHDRLLIKESVDDSYFLSKTHFLSCNINVNHAIKYHRDAGNFRGTLSNVLILRNNISGGELVFPEYGFALEQGHGYLAIFPGQSEIHGVMPVELLDETENFYRASIVFYALEMMKHCYPFEEEVLRLQTVKTDQAQKKAKGILPGEKTE